MENAKISRKKNDCLSFVKGLSCIGVVFMHCSFPMPYGRIISYCFLFAVPIFFFTSGFFSYYEDKEVGSKKIVAKIIHILKLTIISELTYFLYNILLEAFKDGVPLGGGAQLTAEDVLKAVFLNFPLFNGTLWFMYALLFSYIALFFVNKFNLYKVSYFIGPAILLLHVIIRPIIKNCNFDWYDAGYFRNFLLYGFPLLIIGHCIRANKDKVSKIKNKFVIGTVLIGTPLIFAEYFISMQVLDFYFTSIVVAIAVFIFAINNAEKNYIPLVTYIGDKLSMYIYIVHMICISLTGYLLAFLGVSGNTIVEWITPIVALIFSIALAYLVEITMNKCKKYKF